MKKVLLFLILCFVLVGNIHAQNDSLLKLWYNHPARQWVEALPIYNGMLGAMIFGGPSQEQIQLNESTVWAGSPYNNANPKALKALPVIRKLIFNGDFKLDKAKGKNPNPFFVVPHIKKPLISPEAKIKPVKLKKSYLYDFNTKAGKEYTLVISK